jgi:hypothetical protein
MSPVVLLVVTEQELSIKELGWESEIRTQIDGVRDRYPAVG